MGSTRQAPFEVTENLSAGGVFLRTDAVHEIGEQLEILLDTGEPSLAPIRILAEVVRVESGESTSAPDENDRGLALRFIDASPAQIFQIAVLLNQEEQATGDMTHTGFQPMAILA